MGDGMINNTVLLREDSDAAVASANALIKGMLEMDSALSCAKKKKLPYLPSEVGIKSPVLHRCEGKS